MGYKTEIAVRTAIYGVKWNDAAQAVLKNAASLDPKGDASKVSEYEVDLYVKSNPGADPNAVTAARKAVVSERGALRQAEHRFLDFVQAKNSTLYWLFLGGRRGDFN